MSTKMMYGQTLIIKPDYLKLKNYPLAFLEKIDFLETGLKQLVLHLLSHLNLAYLELGLNVLAIKTYSTKGGSDTNSNLLYLRTSPVSDLASEIGYPDEILKVIQNAANSYSGTIRNVKVLKNNLVS